jgi:ComF family protein
MREGRARCPRAPPSSREPGSPSRLATALDPLVAFVFPDSCVACGAALGRGERHLCRRCWSGLGPAVHTIELGAASRGGRVEDDRPACYLLPFAGATRALIHALKYGRRTSVAPSLIGAVEPALVALPFPPADVIVPVPLHAVRRRERGFNQARLLAAEIARRLETPLDDGLVRARPTADQTGLDRAARLANVRRAFAATGLRGARVLLVDDVVTTGATLSAAAAALLDAGALSVGCLAVAGRS